MLYRVLRQEGTERAFSGRPYWNEHRKRDVYVCAGCGADAVRLGHQVRLGDRLAELLAPRLFRRA